MRENTGICSTKPPLTLLEWAGFPCGMPTDRALALSIRAAMHEVLSRQTPRARPRWTMGVGARFLIVLAVLIPCLFSIALTGTHGLHQLGETVHHLYSGSVVTSEAVEDLDSGLNDAVVATLSILSSEDQQTRSAQERRLLDETCGRVDAALVALDRVLESGEEVEREALRNIVVQWRGFYRIAASGRLSGGDARERGQAATEARALLSGATKDGRRITRSEAEEARAAMDLALSRRARSLEIIGVTLALALILGIGVVIWLIRSVLTRTLTYSRFAARVADGDDSPMEQPAGADEIGQLGTALQEMAARGRSRRAYEKSQ